MRAPFGDIQRLRKDRLCAVEGQDLTLLIDAQHHGLDWRIQIQVSDVPHLVASTEGRLTPHFLPGYAPDLNPDELVWGHAKRTGVARQPLHESEKLEERVYNQLQAIADDPKQGHSFFKHSSAACISGC